MSERVTKHKKLLAWWWEDGSGKLAYEDGRKIVMGEKLELLPMTPAQARWGPPPTLGKECPIWPCGRGFHASVDIFDALEHLKGPVIHRVELSGLIVEAYEGAKHVATERTHLWSLDATQILGEWKETILDRWPGQISLASFGDVHVQACEAMCQAGSLAWDDAIKKRRACGYDFDYFDHGWAEQAAFADAAAEAEKSWMRKSLLSRIAAARRNQ